LHVLKLFITIYSNCKGVIKIMIDSYVKGGVIGEPLDYVRTALAGANCPLEYDYLFKIICIGDPDVGKTAILNRYIYGQYRPQSSSTIGFDLLSKRIIMESTGHSVKLMLWDTAGQERFRAITTNTYRGVQGVFYVYDITSRKTFENISNWIKEVSSFLTPNTICILIGNKCDNEEKREVDYNEAIDFADRNRMYYVEVSARDGIEIERAFYVMTRKLIEKNPILGGGGGGSGTGSRHSAISLVSVSEPGVKKQKRKRYC